MICKTKPSGCAPRIGSTRSSWRTLGACALVFALAIAAPARADEVDPEIARLFERALQEAETFRKQLRTAEYEAKMRVQEWDGRGRLRGTAKAHAIMRPGDTRPVTFISREVEGKVRLPDDKEESKEEDEREVTFQEFAREHRIAERFDFTVVGSEEVASERARRIAFQPKAIQPPKKNTADRFIAAISGTAWISEETNKLVKFEMKLNRPFQLLWILAVLKDLEINYELLSPGEILGHARLKVVFALSTPVYSIRQQHDVDLDKFRRRETVTAAR